MSKSTKGTINFGDTVYAVSETLNAFKTIEMILTEKTEVFNREAKTVTTRLRFDSVKSKFPLYTYQHYNTDGTLNKRPLDREGKPLRLMPIFESLAQAEVFIDGINGQNKPIDNY